MQSQIETRRPWAPTVFPKTYAARGRQLLLILSTAACFLLASLLLFHRAPSPSDDEPFPVATEREVVILRVEGADTGTLVVGTLPVEGPLELLGPGDVKLTSVTPAQRDNLVPELHDGGSGRPIIWVRAQAEED